MSAHGFKSVFMAASVAGAALGCYLVSLNVASERAKLEDVEEQIVLAQRDIRVLQTEIGTRGRLAQLERWNARFIRLSAPSADQFVDGGYQLSALVRPDKKPVIQAPVVLASAPAAAAPARPLVTSDADDTPPPAVVAAKARDAADMLHTASYEKPAAPADKPAPPPAPKKPVKIVASVTSKPVKSATGDPLAPLPTAFSSAKGGALKPSLAKPKDSNAAR
jgi:hypothetical protein